MALSGKAVAFTTGGFILLWSGIKGDTLAVTLRSLLKGQNPARTPETAPSIGIAGGSGSAAGTAAQQILGSGAQGGTPAKNQNIARMLAASYGWSSGTEWDDLVSLWQRESSWSNTAQNPSSGAYGIPQALPSTKMPKSAQPPSDGGTSDATSQISWGLAYIKSTYGSPSAAWAHEQSAGWY